MHTSPIEYTHILSSIGKSLDNNSDLCSCILGVNASSIKNNVLISPGWDISTFQKMGNWTNIGSNSRFGSIEVWNMDKRGITFIRTGCGAGQVLDAMIPLGLTSCRRILFVSSIGALDDSFMIGDIIIPMYAISCDGASRYISSLQITEDIFGERVYPDTNLFNLVKRETVCQCNELNASWHIGKTLCVDSILLEFLHYRQLLQFECNSLDMETSVAFRCAKLMNIPLAAIMCITDNPTKSKSILNKLNTCDEKRKRNTKRMLIPSIITHCFEQF